MALTATRTTQGIVLSVKQMNGPLVQVEITEADAQYLVDRLSDYRIYAARYDEQGNRIPLLGKRLGD